MTMAELRRIVCLNLARALGYIERTDRPGTYRLADADLLRLVLEEGNDYVPRVELAVALKDALAALASERAAREKAERERDDWEETARDHMWPRTRARAEAAEARVAALEEALRKVAAIPIGPSSTRREEAMRDLSRAALAASEETHDG